MKQKVILFFLLLFSKQIFGSAQEKLFQPNQNYIATMSYYLARKGFFAEINCMLNGIIFCLHNNIKLNLISDFFIYRQNCGWEDYFEPFTETLNPSPSLKHFICDGLGATFNVIYNYDFLNINVPRLDLKPNDIFENKRKIAQLVYRYSERTKKLIDHIKADVELPNDYVAFHIRRGDKVGEAKLDPQASIEAKKYPAKDYLEKLLNEKSLDTTTSASLRVNGFEIRNIFVCSDSYEAVEELKNFIEEENLDIKIFTTCKPSNKGWSTKEKTEKFENKFYEVIRLIADTDICLKSKYFVGTYSSNMSRFITLMHDNTENCFSMDTFIDPFPTKLHEKFNYKNGWSHA